MVDQISSFNNFMEEELKTSKEEKQKPQTSNGGNESVASIDSSLNAKTRDDEIISPEYFQKQKPQSISGSSESNATSEKTCETEETQEQNWKSIIELNSVSAPGISNEILPSNPNTEKAQELLSQVVAKERKRTLDILALAGLPEDSEHLIREGASVGDAAIYIRKKELEARKHSRPKENLIELEADWSKADPEGDLVEEVAAMANKGA